jgi:Sec-independent protein translocase protein TatA
MSDVLLVLLIVLGAVIVVRGPKTLPKLGEAFGRGVKAARDGLKHAPTPGDDEADRPEDPPGARS